MERIFSEIFKKNLHMSEICSKFAAKFIRIATIRKKAIIDVLFF